MTHTDTYRVHFFIDVSSVDVAIVKCSDVDLVRPGSWHRNLALVQALAARLYAISCAFVIWLENERVCKAHSPFEIIGHRIVHLPRRYGRLARHYSACQQSHLVKVPFKMIKTIASAFTHQLQITAYVGKCQTGSASHIPYIQVICSILGQPVDHAVYPLVVGNVGVAYPLESCL